MSIKPRINSNATLGHYPEEVYQGLHAKIGTGRISRFIDALARPHVVDTELDAAYKGMAADASRESGALEWVENLTGDVADEPR